MRRTFACVCDLRRGTSMVEALTAITITAIAGAALLTSSMAAVQASTELVRTSIAQGLADQLLDEMTAVRFPKGGTQLVPANATRAQFDDLDDFNGWTERPPRDRYGVRLGAQGPISTLQVDEDAVAPYERTIRVEKVAPSGTGWTVVSTATTYRRVTIEVAHWDARKVRRPLATISRIFAEVPAGP